MNFIKIFILLSTILFPSSILANAGYFPENVFFPERADLHIFKTEWYCKHLKVLEEPSIFQQKTLENLNIFRFTWLRTFDHPISIRLEINNDETGTVYIKMSDGAGGYEPGNIIKNDKIEIRKQTYSTIVNAIEKMNFWNLRSSIDQMGLDGSQWIIEGLSNGEYHIVERWSPETGAIRDLGLMFLDLSGIQVEEIY